MKLEYSFDQDVETVFEMATDPDFLVERSDAMGELDCEVEVEDSDNHSWVTMTRTVQRDLPAFLAKLFNPKQTLHFKEEWQHLGERKLGTYTVDVEGQPVKVSARFELEPEGDGSKYSITFSCKANIPMVGKKVEKFIIGQTESGATKELDFLRDKLNQA